jgi:uncharacterized membrane-anchored protein
MTSVTTSPSQPTKKRWWQFWLPLAVQILVIGSVPAQAIYTSMTGRTVYLQTVPVDPYGFLTGYSQTLRYDISSVDRLKKLPGGKDLTNDQVGQVFYVTLQAEPTPSKPWKPIAVSLTKPQNLPSNQIALRGKARYAWIDYGLETYYMPEDQKDEINQIIRENQTKKPAIVEVKIDNNGHAIPVSIDVADRKLQF